MLFMALSFIWGSSFILMKEGIKELSAYQVAAIRILSGGLVLLPIGIRKIKGIPRNKFGYVVLSGLLGSFIPAFLFCIAETRIDSSLAGFLNALTPVFTIIVGILFFQSTVQTKKIVGVVIAFSGMVVLLFSNGMPGLQDFGYASFVLMATLCYAVNVNMVNRVLKGIRPLDLAAVSLGALTIPSLLVLVMTGYFSLPVTDRFLYSTGASVVLGLMGTAVATVLFYMLLKKAGPLFASMVTYGIPFVALFWGLVTGETINAVEIVALAIILTGVYRANK